jgi:hypothetical protein
MTAEERLKARMHDLSLHGAVTRDEARALGLLSYSVTTPTLRKLVEAIRGDAL